MSAPDQTTPPGTPVHLDFRKYDGTQHWQEPYSLLGVDDFGVWLGMPADTLVTRPGREFRPPTPSVRLIPHQDRWAAIFNGPGSGVTIHTYVDITDLPVWSHEGSGFRIVVTDLDLDVVRGFDGAVLMDDEDEFAEHTLAFGYPPELVEATRESGDRVLAAVRSGAAPFDSVAQDWLAQV